MSIEVKNNAKRKIAIIIGAGPAGLTAAYELLCKTDIHPIVLEKSNTIGGIARTVYYKGNRIDVGGHRFFSKSPWVMAWWLSILPLQGAPAKDDILLGRKVYLSQEPKAPNPEKEDRVMLVRRRLSRIYFLRRFFDYPISLNWNIIQNLGLLRTIRIAFSYLRARLFPIKKERSLKDFLINRFGNELYIIFFKDYTEKVWGVPCSRIPPEWGKQRVKGLSIAKALAHAFKKVFQRRQPLGQKRIETSLIEYFFYPKLGPGQMWETVAHIVKERGGEIYLQNQVVGISCEDKRIRSVTIKDKQTGMVRQLNCDYCFSTMPVKELISAMNNHIVPINVKEVAEGLLYRNSIMVGLLLRRLKVENKTKNKTINNIIPDTWIYIQEKDVRVGRLQIFNNWSPYIIADNKRIWLGAEYFCDENDELWHKTDAAMAQYAIDELAKIDFLQKEDVLDSLVTRMEKTYPAYFGKYNEFRIVREFTDTFENLFLIGRNGMHKYNNMDHSMLTAMTAVENIIYGVNTKDNIWAVNAEDIYIEGGK